MHSNMDTNITQQKPHPDKTISSNFTTMSMEDASSSSSKSSGRPWLIILLILLTAGLSVISILLLAGIIPSAITDLEHDLSEVKSNIQEQSEVDDQVSIS